MDIYHFHPVTGEVLGAGQADPDPLDTENFLIPANATSAQPPATGSNEVAVFSGGAWQVVADYRGTEYWLADGSHFEIEVIGETPPEDALYAEPPEPLKPVAERRSEAKTEIDVAAGQARARFVSPGDLVELEYQQAEQAVKDWRAAGSPAGNVPADIQVWAAAAGMTIEQAATDIEQTSTLWRGVLTAVRQIRLDGKAAVDAATDLGTADDMQTVAQPFITQLEALGT